MNIKDLNEKLKELGVEDSSYSLSGELNWDRIVLSQDQNKWEIFYLDERGGRNYLSVFENEALACEAMYKLLVEKHSERIKEEEYELEIDSLWKGANIEKLAQELNRLGLYVKSNNKISLEVSINHEYMILRKEYGKWNLYIRYIIYTNDREMRIKTYIHEDAMCCFLYNYCSQRINFENNVNLSEGT